MKAADSTLRSLSSLNFAVAAMQAGFGPFISVRLTASGWTPGAIGIVLSAGTIAAVVAQVPSGIVIDRFGARRGMATAAILGSMAALLMFSLAPGFWLILGAELVQGGSGVGLALAIAAITLGLARQERLGERLGRNVRFAAVGAALGTAALGFVGSTVSATAAFLLAAAVGIPALLALRGIREADLASAAQRTAHHTAPPPRARRSPPVPPQALLRDPGLLALLACAVLFQLANASLLPLAATEFSHAAGRHADLVTAAAVTVPQLLAAMLSPHVGIAAQRHGRRLVLMLGLAAVPLRAVGFACDGTIPVMLTLQALDGISAATIGVLIPLVVADITHRGGRFNFALGLTGLAGALGATLSTAASGSLADRAGLPAAFLALAVAGLAAIVVVWMLLPETAHLTAEAHGTPRHEPRNPGRHAASRDPSGRDRLAGRP
ncbi:MAG: MFS transporter [Rhodospirillales bacterium]|nr:MFS transporter [Rhodospirillales bacterium]